MHVREAELKDDDVIEIYKCTDRKCSVKNLAEKKK
jgi:hypothetical protein